MPIGRAMLTEISNEKNLPISASMIFIGSAIGGCFVDSRFTNSLLGPIICSFLSSPENIKGLIRVFPVFEKVDIITIPQP